MAMWIMGHTAWGKQNGSVKVTVMTVKRMVCISNFYQSIVLLQQFVTTSAEMWLEYVLIFFVQLAVIVMTDIIEHAFSIIIYKTITLS